MQFCSIEYVTWQNKEFESDCSGAPIKLVGSSPMGAAVKMYDTVPFSISLSL